MEVIVLPDAKEIGGVAADAGPLGVGLQQHDFAARTGIAGAFIQGATQLNSSSWLAPDGNTGRWANAGSVAVGWPAFAGPAGDWHLDWAGADATPWGNPVAFVYVPVGSYWPEFRCAHDCMFPAALP